MLKEKNWLDEVHDACGDAFDVSYQMEGLAKVLYRVGNEKGADELAELAGVIREAQKTVRTAIGKMLYEQVQAGEKETALVLKVALASAMRY